MGRLARVPSRWLARAFVRAYDVDLAEAEHDDYPSVDALFTRRLRPGARPIDADPDVVVSPVDGRVAWCGATDGTLPLGPEPIELAEVVGREGTVREAAVIYLAPRDYHRVHAPLGGRVTGFRYVPGSRWPVRPAAVRRIPRVLARNERLVLWQHTGWGPAVVVLVGAFGVARIRSPLVDVPGHAAEGPLDVAIGPGEEIGVFHLGSTVVIGLPAPVRWAVQAQTAVRMGRPLAHFGDGLGGGAALRLPPA